MKYSKEVQSYLDFNPDLIPFIQFTTTELSKEKMISEVTLELFDDFESFRKILFVNCSIHENDMDEDEQVDVGEQVFEQLFEQYFADDWEHLDSRVVLTIN